MLADCGVASRRKSEELIAAGKVKVNGKVAVIGDKVDPVNDKVYVSGRRVTGTARPDLRYIMLNKPRGVLTTMSDEKGRKCVADLIRDIPERVYPIGRLDRDSEGMLLLTNDGEFANHIMHPKKHVNKVYRVTVRPNITDDQVNKLEGGIVLDGRKTAPAQVRVVTREEGRVVLEEPPDPPYVRRCGAGGRASQAHRHRLRQARRAQKRHVPRPDPRRSAQALRRPESIGERHSFTFVKPSPWEAILPPQTPFTNRYPFPLFYHAYSKT